MNSTQDYVYILQEKETVENLCGGYATSVVVKGDPLIFLTAYDLALFLGISPDSPVLEGNHHRGNKIYVTKKARIAPSANRKVAPGATAQTKN